MATGVYKIAMVQLAPGATLADAQVFELCVRTEVNPDNEIPLMLAVEDALLATVSVSVLELPITVLPVGELNEAVTVAAPVVVVTVTVTGVAAPPPLLPLQLENNESAVTMTTAKETLVKFSIWNKRASNGISRILKEFPNSPMIKD